MWEVDHEWLYRDHEGCKGHACMTHGDNGSMHLVRRLRPTSRLSGALGLWLNSNVLVLLQRSDSRRGSVDSPRSQSVLESHVFVQSCVDRALRTAHSGCAQVLPVRVLANCCDLRTRDEILCFSTERGNRCLTGVCQTHLASLWREFWIQANVDGGLAINTEAHVRFHKLMGSHCVGDGLRKSFAAVSKCVHRLVCRVSTTSNRNNESDWLVGKLPPGLQDCEVAWVVVAQTPISECSTHAIHLHRHTGKSSRGSCCRHGCV